MPHKCFLTGCKNYQSSTKSSNKLYFYNLGPIIKDKQRAKQWASILGIYESTFSRKDVICSEHFTEDCFNASDLLKQRLLPHSRFKAPRLLPHAIPFLSEEILKCGIIKRRKNRAKEQSTENEQGDVSDEEGETHIEPNNETKHVDTFEPVYIKEEPAEITDDIQNDSALHDFEATMFEEEHSNIQVKEEKIDEAQFVMFDGNDNSNETKEPVRQISPHSTETVKYDPSASVSIQNSDILSPDKIKYEPNSNQNSDSEIIKQKEICDILKCNFCDFENENKMLLQTHIKHLHLNQCKKNIKVFKNQHIDTNCSVAKIKCDICSQRFKFYFRVKKTKKGVRSECDKTVCNFIWSKNSNFICKKKEDKMIYPCNQCFKCFSNKNEFKNHLFEHYSSNI